MGLVAWVDVPAMTTRAAKVGRKSVLCSSNGANGRFAHWLALSIRGREIDLDWLSPGMPVSVQIGGEDGRQMRINAGGLHVLRSVGGKKASGVSILKIPALAGQSANAQLSEGIVHEICGGFLVVTLPDWCFARSAVGDAGATLVKRPGFKMTAPSHKDAVFGNGAAGG